VSSHAGHVFLIWHAPADLGTDDAPKRENVFTLHWAGYQGFIPSWRILLTGGYALLASTNGIFVLFIREEELGIDISPMRGWDGRRQAILNAGGDLRLSGTIDAADIERYQQWRTQPRAG
jgi:hypothetical protein